MHDSGKALQLLILHRGEEQAITDWKRKYLPDGDIQIVRMDSVEPSKDIVIVNPQMEMTQGWLDALLQGINSYVNVGTVSPILEIELEQNSEEVREHHALISMEHWDKMLKACATDIYPEVPINLFDCIYIRGEVLDELGMPDEGIIYDGEKAAEWFQKVTQMGWKHRVSCKAMLRGDSLYDANRTFHKERLNTVGKETIKLLGECIRLYSELHFNNGRCNILHYLLADFQEGMKNNVGGTQFHVSDLVEYQKHLYNVFVLARDGAFLRLTEYVDDEKKQFDFYVGDVEDNIAFYDKNHEELYRKILKIFDIELVHVHHTLWMPLNIFYVANECQIPIVLSIHDFYYVCPVLNMINLKGVVCSKQSCEVDCGACLEERKKIHDGKAYLNKWYKEHKKIMELCSKVIFPSKTAANTLCEYYPSLNNKAVVIEHGIKLPDRIVNNDYKHERLRVAFIGGISEVKGGPVIYDLITSEKRKYDWYIMGGIGYMDLYHLNQDNLVKTGWYKRYEIYDLLSKYEIDIVCILSTVAETFCYTLSEAIAAGIPVIATSVGALEKRVSDMGCGWLVPRNAGAKEILQVLDNIVNNIDEYHTMRKHIKELELRDINVMGVDYDFIYRDYLQFRHGRDVEMLSKMLTYQHFEDEKQERFNESVQGADEGGTEIEEKMRLIACEQELNELKQSLLVRVALKIRAINFPGRKKIYWIICRILGK